MQIDTDILILGSGAAGLCAALHLAKTHRVAVLCKSALYEGSTRYAQGGIAAVLSMEDSVQAHVRDTMIAGCGVNDEAVVRFTVEQGPTAIEWLIDQGVPFTKEHTADGKIRYHLAREGGHSHRRIIHSDDATGESVVQTLMHKVQAQPNITIYEYHLGIDLIRDAQRCLGCYVYNQREKRVDVFASKAVLLATGGASRAYLYTTNPAVSSGDGIAMARRAGCQIRDMEFNQFHPTCLYHPQAGSFLLTEALRGEGAYLRLPDGTRFMAQFDERAELAPRDIVARAIDHEMKRLGLDCVYLDISHRPKTFIVEHFPNIYQRCLKYGFDMAAEPVPVVPAAHYTCGGVVVDQCAQTSLPGLYAAGEVSCTGLHGANRMASNSLLECLVYAKAAAEAMVQHTARVEAPKVLTAWDESWVEDSDEAVLVSQNWDEIRRCMWSYVGIVRSNKRLQRAKARIELLKSEINEFYAHFRVTRDLIELRNLIVVADLIVDAAIARKESIGLHYNVDYPSKV
jgi:L-aspartate oxidase